eukprot:jgi/Phyca11/21802/fgenesh1_pg.PHYCAscaffold_126_\
METATGAMIAAAPVANPVPKKEVMEFVQIEDGCVNHQDANDDVNNGSDVVNMNIGRDEDDGTMKNQLEGLAGHPSNANDVTPIVTAKTDEPRWVETLCVNVGKANTQTTVKYMVMAKADLKLEKAQPLSSLMVKNELSSDGE